MKINYACLGLAIRQIRESRKMTQEQLGKLAGVTVSFISRLENGKRGVSIPKINALSEGLGIPPVWIYFLATDARGARSLNGAIRALQDLIRAEIGITAE